MPVETSVARAPVPVPAGTVRGELSNLDTLRTFAVLAVLTDHLTLTLNGLTLKNALLGEFVMRLGHFGVIAFFVHTSLVLMFSLQRLHHDCSRPALAFYLRRWFRIYPLSMITVIAAAILRFPDRPFQTMMASHYTPWNITLNLLLLQNFGGLPITGPLWSLPFEVQMYVILPALYLLARRPRSYPIFFASIILLWPLGATVYAFTGKLHFFAFMPCFLSGILAYTLRMRLRPVIPARWWGFFIPAIMVMASSIGAVWPRLEYVISWVLALCLGVSIYLFHDSTAAGWNRVTKYVAKYSYGIYLLHIPSIWLVFQVAGISNLSLAPIVTLILTGALSIAAFHAIEDPMIQFGKRLSQKFAGRTARATAL